MGSTISKVKPVTPYIFDKIPVLIWDSTVPNTYELRFELRGISNFHDTRKAIYEYLEHFGYDDATLNRHDQLKVIIKSEDLQPMRTGNPQYPVSHMYSWSDFRSKN